MNQPKITKRTSDSLTRRAFVQRAAVATLAVPGIAPAIHAADKAGSRPAVIGSGEHTYECIHDWGNNQLPRAAHYGNASHGVAIDKSGLIYITHYGDPGSIFVFDPDGSFVKSMGEFHQVPGSDGHGKEARGHGIDIRQEGGQEFIYLASSDKNMDFAKTDLNGEIVWRKGRKELHEDTGRYDFKVAYRPTNVSFSPDGGYFLGDGYGSNLIHHYDRDDNYVRTIGSIGTGDGEFQTPHGQWLDQRDGQAKLVVADRANKRLQWFDMEGEHLKTLDGFLFPADIDIQGDLLVVPDLHCRITLLDRDDNVIVQLGEDPVWREKALEGFKMRNQRQEWLPGKFIHPHDACFDADGNIFVTEWVDTGRVTKLRKVS